MGKLNGIVDLSVLGVKGAPVLLAAVALFGGLGVCVAADAAAPEGTQASFVPIADEDLEWILGLDARLTADGPVDTLRSGEALEDLSRIWKGHLGTPFPDSLPGHDSPLERILRMQTRRVGLLLAEGDASGPASAREAARRLGRARRAIHNLSELIPLGRAARDSARGVLLVVSSVGCACELRRCENMLTLYGSISADIAGRPLAVADLMEVPALEKVFGQMDIPYWLLFDERGYPGTMVAGDSDADDVRSAVLGWSGLTPDSDD